jgi:hypothetical protein
VPTADFTTVIAFLQCGGPDTNIVPLCKAFEDVCSEHVTGGQYAYMRLSGLQLRGDEGGLAGRIEATAKQAHQQGKKGLVLLTGVRGGVGLDVKEVSVKSAGQHLMRYSKVVVRA